MIRPRLAIMLLCTLLLWISSPHTDALAVELAGVQVPATVQVTKHRLQLNGAGIRSKFIFDIYVCALYLAVPSSDVQQIMHSHTRKRIRMHFLYSVSGERLNSGWQSGFSRNLSAAQRTDLSARLKQFYAMFDDMESGENIIFDFLADGSTQVYVHHRLAGNISGSDFQQALLSIWLGSQPADPALKTALLGR